MVTPGDLQEARQHRANMKPKRVLSHYYQRIECSIPKTVVYLVDKSDLEEYRFEFTGHLKLNQIIEICDCIYIKPN